MREAASRSDAAIPMIGDSETARKQSYDKKNQERFAYRPQYEDRHRGAEFSASRNRVQAVRYSEATNQWPQPRWRCVSSCDVLDPLGYVLVAVFQHRLVHDEHFASGRSDHRQVASILRSRGVFRRALKEGFNGDGAVGSYP